MNHREVVVEEPAAEGMRLDRFIAEELALFSRSQLKHRAVAIRVNGAEAKPSHRLKLGDRVRIEYEDEAATTVLPEPIDLDVLFENDEVVVINKPQGMVVHPAAGNSTGTLVQGLAYRWQSIRRELSADNLRPGIVHRLDKATSGVIIAAKNPEARRFLANQFRKRRTEKVYLAIVKGVLYPRKGTIESYIRRDPAHRKRFMSDPSAGKYAVTDYAVLHQWKQHAFIALYPHTGRTHQLRVHMASRNSPIVGDEIYARPDPSLPDTPLLLHAHRLTIVLPKKTSQPSVYTGGERVTFRAPLPPRFKTAILKLAGRD